MLHRLRLFDGLRSRGLAVAVGLAAVAATLGVTPSSAATRTADAGPHGLYIVQLADSPLATYQGGVAGVPATKPAAGAKLASRSSGAQLYRDHLSGRRSDVLRQSGIAVSAVVSDYSVTFNGFAAQLNAAEVEKLRGTAGVAGVYKSRAHQAQTVNSPRFLGLSGSDGVWARRFGGQAKAGEGVIIGVIDGGYWPEAPSYAALAEPRPDAAVIAAKWSGTCDAGEEAPVSCNNKVIGARWYDAGGYGDDFEGEFRSPRDSNGHGSHTSSTAAGVPAEADIAGAPLGQISGMAPAARLAVYKVAWQVTASSASADTADILKAVDDAVSDGVDVINYSLGDNFDEIGPVEAAFLNASATGVFIATSAGNSGPSAGSIDNAAPWTTTVAAGTQDVRYAKRVTLGNGAQYDGAGLGGGLPARTLVDAAAAPAAGVAPTRSALCHLDSLDAAKVAGKVVFCLRGQNGRVEKSAAVLRAGGVGMILGNALTTEALNTEYHSVPTVHVDATAGGAVKSYIASTGASATAILSAMEQRSQPAPGVAAYSSTGTSRSSGGDLLKPDILAPGSDIVAAVPPTTNPANSSFGLKSGTSMSTPHIAGLAALIRQQHPDWSPSAIKSAIMTTAYQKDATGRPIQGLGGGGTATPLEMGAGHVQPAAMFDPGLVYEAGAADWYRYSCGVGANLSLGGGATACGTYGSIDPSDLNYPSIAIGDLYGQQTIARTVTNKTDREGVYTPTVVAPSGITVEVSPSRLTVPAGGTATYRVKFTVVTPLFDRYAFGSLTWSDGRGHHVRSPLVLRPLQLRAQASAAGSGTTGSVEIKATAGYNGTITTMPLGLVAPTVTTARLVGTYNGPFPPGNPPSSPAIHKVTFNAPTDTKLVRFAVHDEYPSGTDIDLYVIRNGVFLGASQGLTSKEEVVLRGGGAFDVYLMQWGLPSGTTENAVRLYSYEIARPAGNLTVNPADQPVTAGQQVTATARWSGLSPGTEYFGAIEFANQDRSLGITALKVNG